MANSLKRFIENHKLSAEFIELPPEQARTSESAAAALKVPVNQIAKSIVLKGSRTYVVVLAGGKRVDLKKFSKWVGESVRLATPDEVQRETGFRVGCVPPFGHIRKLKTFVDVSVFENQVIYASGGEDNLLIMLFPSDLLKVSDRQVVDVSR
ncbi:MAG: YbaK/EbsC family protein [Candidatus Caldarchaeum sp.]|nr:YbaK/EbsC family protein [Candidatus Caldarchaeum sp.]MDW8063854.1 YbaK/EbsC family protein [Candidatus Caldarchaeum sp.]MDW8436272.1 YbaK/EbsC family protein [Candidatus Caldarchaeum sp.]